MRVSTWILVGLLAAATAGCSGNSGSANVQKIPIGEITARTGVAAQGSWETAAQVAVDVANKALGMAGKDYRFDPHVSDSAGDPATAVSGVLSIRDQATPKAFVLDTSEDDTAVSEFLYDSDMSNDYDFPVICFICASPFINNPSITIDTPAVAAAPDPMVRLQAWHNVKGQNFRTSMHAGFFNIAYLSLWQQLANSGDTNGDGMMKISIFSTSDAFGRGASDSLAGAVHTALPAAIVEQIFVDASIDVGSHDWAGTPRAPRTTRRRRRTDRAWSTCRRTW